MWAAAYGPTPGSASSRSATSVVGQVAAAVERLEVERAVGDRGGDRAQVRPAVAGARDVLVEVVGRLGHRLRVGEGAALDTEVLDERGHHANRPRPGAVGGADRLHDVLEDGRAPEHPARPAPGPGELVVVRDHRVEARQVLVEPQHVAHDVEDARRTVDVGVSRPALAHAQRARAAVDRERGLERPRLLVEPVRDQLGDPVRGERAPEVDGLAARADQLELRQRSAPVLRVPRARLPAWPRGGRRGRVPCRPTA